jgi:predicted nucleic acid-binding protein
MVRTPPFVIACSRSLPAEVLLCSVVKAELLFGARKSQRVDANLTKLGEFFAAMESAAFDDVAAEHYGRLRAQLEAAGTPIGANDMMIAAIALAVGATLVTRNQSTLRHLPVARRGSAAIVRPSVERILRCLPELC